MLHLQEMDIAPFARTNQVSTASRYVRQSSIVFPLRRKASGSWDSVSRSIDELRRRAINDFLYALVQCLVSAGFQFLDCFPGRGIWHPYIEWQSAAKHDLAQEHGDRIGGAHSHFRKHPGGPRFEFRLYPRRYEC
jgi:hypothetical protein